MSLPTTFDGTNAAVAPARVEAVAQAVIQAAAEGLARALDSADEALFDLSCRAGNDQGQHGYFDGMRQLRLAREAILKRFRETSLSGWRMQAGMRASGARQTAASEVLSLDLVSEDDLEERLAVDGIVSRCESGMGRSLADLQKALSSSLGRGVDVSDCAIGPRGLCESVRDACSCAPLSLQARLVVLRCFEAEVMPRLPEAYARLAGMLAGVARTAPPRSAPAAPERVRPAAVARPPSNVRPGAPVSIRAANVPQRGPAAAVQARPVANVETSNRVAAASAVQRMFNAAGIALDLAPELETVVRRMELPLVRMAMAQPQMLRDPDHPARKFLGELARWTRRWGRHPPTDAMLIERLSKLNAIDRDDVDGQFEFFDREASVMARAGANQLRRAQLAEQRAREAERGKARLRHAEEEVAELMADSPELLQLPAPLADMALCRWPRYLVLMHLRNAQNGPEWQEAVALLRELAAAARGCGPRSVDATVLAKGVLATGGHLDEVDQCMHALRDLHPVAPAKPPVPDALPAEPVPQGSFDVGQLRLGRSFTLQQHDGHACEVKLAWVGQQGGRFLFVDRRGLKYAEFAREEVEALCASGKLSELDQPGVASAGAA